MTGPGGCAEGAITTVPRSLACLGDSGDIRTWSSTPFFFSQAAIPSRLLTHTMSLMDPRYRQHRLLWSLGRSLRLERPRGYQFSRAAVMRMWQRVPEPLRHGEFISHFQVFPPLGEARSRGARHSFYCDATLRQLFEADSNHGVSAQVVAETLHRETELYQAAQFYVAMAQRTAESAIRDYGVDPQKVYVVRPGANLDDDAVDRYLRDRGASWREGVDGFTLDRPARLGFIGRDWVRKGLPRLVAAAEILNRRGRPVRVVVVGHCPERLRRHSLVEWVGLIDKATDHPRFIRTVDAFALGCLPSHAESLGISTLEALRLGVPVFGTNVGGIPDCVPPRAGFLVPANADGEQIADAIEFHVFDADRYAKLVAGAALQHEQVTWKRSVEQLTAIWSGTGSAFAECSSDRSG